MSKVTSAPETKLLFSFDDDGNVTHQKIVFTIVFDGGGIDSGTFLSGRTVTEIPNDGGRVLDYEIEYKDQSNSQVKTFTNEMIIPESEWIRAKDIIRITPKLVSTGAKTEPKGTGSVSAEEYEINI